MKYYSVYPQQEALRLQRLEAQIEVAKTLRLQRQVERILNTITATMWAVMVWMVWNYLQG